MAHRHCSVPDFQATVRPLGIPRLSFSTRKPGISFRKCRASSSRDEQPYNSSAPASSIPEDLIPTEILALRNEDQV